MEFSIGRAAQASPLFMYKKLEKPGQKWGIFGWFCLGREYRSDGILHRGHADGSSIISIKFLHRDTMQSLGFGVHDILIRSVNVLFLLITIGCCVLYSFLQPAGRSGTCHKIYDVCHCWC